MKRVLLLFLLLVVAGCDQTVTPNASAPNTEQSSSSNSNTVENDWPLDNPEKLAVITLDRIMDGTNPILYVTHDANDGGWQFLDGGDVTDQNAMVVSLRENTDHDATIKQLSDLPLGCALSGRPSANHGGGNYRHNENDKRTLVA